MRQINLDDLGKSRLLAEMRKLTQWVCFIENQKPDGKIGKLPINPKTLHGAISTKPETWGSYSEAVEKVGKSANIGKIRGTVSGVGFMLSESDPYMCFDLDHVIDEDGVLSDWAEELVLDLGSYTEKSLSGSGLHIWVKGKIPDGDYKHKREIIPGQDLECYEKERFMVMTGDVFAEDPVRGDPEKIIAVMDRYLKEPEKKKKDKPLQQDIPPVSYQPEIPVTMTDQDIIDLMMKSESGSRIRSLWDGFDDGDPSKGDMSLIGSLHFYCGGDPDLIERIFLNSGRVRDKTLSKRGSSTYLRYSIDNYCRKHAGDPVYDPSYREAHREERDGSGALQGIERGAVTPLDVISGSELAEKDLPPLTWLLHDMIPLGAVGLIASPPKTGKSIFCEMLSLSVASGTELLKRQTTQAGVLYLALEDSIRRLKDRQEAMIKGRDISDNLFYATESLMLSDQQTGLLKQVGDFIDKHDHVKLIIIDVLGKVKPTDKGKDSYDHYYKVVFNPLQQFAKDRGVTVLLVMHTNKSVRDLSDPFDGILGSVGIRGAVDFSFIMKPDTADKSEIHFYTEGKDLDGDHFILRKNGLWLDWVGTYSEQEAIRNDLEIMNDPIIMSIMDMLQEAALDPETEEAQIITSAKEISDDLKERGYQITSQKVSGKLNDEETIRTLKRNGIKAVKPTRRTKPPGGSRGYYWTFTRQDKIFINGSGTDWTDEKLTEEEDIQTCITLSTLST